MNHWKVSGRDLLICHYEVANKGKKSPLRLISQKLLFIFSPNSVCRKTKLCGDHCYLHRCVYCSTFGPQGGRDTLAGLWPLWCSLQPALCRPCDMAKAKTRHFPARKLFPSLPAVPGINPRGLFPFTSASFVTMKSNRKELDADHILWVNADLRIN